MIDLNNQGVETYCPMCRKQVIKVVETDKEYKTGEIICISEYYAHYDTGKLIKFKNPRHDYYSKV